MNLGSLRARKRFSELGPNGDGALVPSPFLFDHAIFAWGCQRRIILAKDAKKSTKFKEVINVITDVSYPGQAKAISYGGKGAIGIRKWLDGAC